MSTLSLALGVPYILPNQFFAPQPRVFALYPSSCFCNLAIQATNTFVPRITTVFRYTYGSLRIDSVLKLGGSAWPTLLKVKPPTHEKVSRCWRATVQDQAAMMIVLRRGYKMFRASVFEHRALPLSLLQLCSLGKNLLGPRVCYGRLMFYIAASIQPSTCRS